MNERRTMPRGPKPEDITVSERSITYDFPTYVKTVQRVVRERFATIGVDPDTYRFPVGSGEGMSLDDYAELLCVQGEVVQARDGFFEDFMASAHMVGMDRFWGIFQKEETK